MIHDKKFAQFGRCIFGNYDQNVEMISGGEIAMPAVGGIEYWVIYLFTQMKNGRLIVFPAILAANTRMLKFCIRFYLNFVSDSGSTKYLTETKRYHSEAVIVLNGYGAVLSNILDPDNGFYKNGSLVVEYGIYVESIQEKDGIWNFNLFDAYGHENGNLIVLEYEDTEVQHVCLKQYLTFHSPFFAKYDSKLSPKNIQVTLQGNTADTDVLEQCLQIAHGVRLDLDVYELFKTARSAHIFELHNVKRYCEDKLIEKDQLSNFDQSLGLAHRICLHRYTKYLIYQADSLKKIKFLLTEENIEKVSPENLKMVVARFVKGDLK